VFDSTVTSEVDTRTLRENSLRESNAGYPGREFVLVQDGAPAHTTQVTIDQLTPHCIIYPGWPAHIPDLNPVEQVCGIMKRKLNWAKVQTSDEAIHAVLNAGNSIEMSVIDTLCASFPARTEKILAAGGQTIQPLLNSKQEVPPGHLSDRPHLVPPAPWTPEEDQILMRARTNPRFPWETTARQFIWRSIASVRTHRMLLKTIQSNEENQGHMMVSMYDFLRY
jgi:hypothetical protein